jgi:hypothetical protein
VSAGRSRAFSSEFDDEFTVGSEEGNKAFFGRSVLRGLVEGIDDFIRICQPQWERYRSLGPALLGSAMWIDDWELIRKLDELSGAVIVVKKQGRAERDLSRLARRADRARWSTGRIVRRRDGSWDRRSEAEGACCTLGVSPEQERERTLAPPATPSPMQRLLRTVDLSPVLEGFQQG